jgi:hypothetical protein
MKKKKLTLDTIRQFNSALSKLTGFNRRAFAAELCEFYFNSSPREMEKVLSVGREMVKLGMHERRTGIRCIDGFSYRGRKKKKPS